MLTWNSNVRATGIVAFYDEDALVLDAVRRILRHESYDVVMASDPGEILEFPRPIDVLVVEIEGLELLRRVRAASPRVRGVLLTEGNDLARIADAVNDGMLCRLIRIPWGDDELRRILRGLLEGPVQNPPARHEPEEPRVVRRLRCRGRSGEQVLAEAKAAGRAVIVLEDLFALEGSIPDLLTELIQTSSTIVDGTGCANLVLDCFSRRFPVAVYGSEREVPEPKRILYVGKPSESSAFIRDLLESAGHHCACVSSLGEAPAEFDLLLLDSSLPEETAVDLMEEVLDRGWKVPIVTVSSRPPRELLRAIEGSAA